MKEAMPFKISEDLENEAEIRYSKYNGEELIEDEQKYEDKQNVPIFILCPIKGHSYQLNAIRSDTHDQKRE